LSCQQRLGSIHAPNEFWVPMMMEVGTLIWEGDHGPLPGSEDKVEKNAYRKALSPDERRLLKTLVGFFGFCVAESRQEP
jgi:hypothetical protein